MIRFTSPLALLWLLLILPIMMIGWPSKGMDRRRELISLVLRLVICLGLILAMAGLEFKDFGTSNTLSVVFLLDVSDSMQPEEIRIAIDSINNSFSQKNPDDQAALIVFGGEALVEKTMSRDISFDGLTSIPITNQTNLAQAVNLGIAMFPPGTAKRMIILSDGVFTTGNSFDALKVAVASGVDVMVVPLTTELAPEILVDDISVPPNLRQGDQFDLNITLSSNISGVVTIRVFSNGLIKYEGDQVVTRGIQTFNLQLTADTPGFTAYQVSINSQTDQYYQNNQLSTYSQIIGRPRILIVAPPAGELLTTQGSLRPDEFSPLQRVLESNGFQVDVSIPELFASDLPSLAGYSSIVLIDVPARRFNSAQMNNLQSFVRDLGGGLVTIGGPTSYGVGGYFRTPLEDILPLDMQIKDEKRRPTLALVFIIDRSGSMSETSGGPTKLDLAKEAVIRSIELLNPIDQVGVIVFDDAASWIVPITELNDGNEVRSRVGSISIGGGTDILAGIQIMAADFPSIQAGARHVILLTDGGADPTGIPELVDNLFTQEGITISTIGVGRDAAPYLADIAALGGGRYHFAENPGSIPNIYAEETSLATRSYIIEEPFIPNILAQSPMLNEINNFPELLGYVGTSPKVTAQTILTSHKGDPILAYWRYGLGKSIAFTSDSSGRWAKQWLTWSQFGTFWSQIVRYSVSDQISTNLDIQTTFMDGLARIQVDTGVRTPTTVDSDPYFLNNYDMEANVIMPNGSVINTKLSQIEPGKYQAEFTPTEEGVYLIRVNGIPPDQGIPPVAEIAGWSLDYSPEYRQLNTDVDSLTRLTYQSGGRLVNPEFTNYFEHTLNAPGTYTPAWPWLLLAAVFLFPFDIALRRLILNKSDFQRGLKKLLEIIPFRNPNRETVSEPTERMQALFNVKEKTELRFGSSSKNKNINQTEERDSLIKIQVVEPEQPHPKPAKTITPTSEKSEIEPTESSVGKLLEIKRKQRKN